MSDLKAHPFQVAGHGSMLRCESSGTILKPLSETELSAYERAPAVLKRGGFLARMIGTRPDADGSPHLELEDLTHGMQRPCLIDIKMGTRQHTSAMSPEKIAYVSGKCRDTTSAALGVRVTGLMVRCGDAIFFFLNFFFY